MWWGKKKRLVVHVSLELTTFALSARRSTDWANGPSTSMYALYTLLIHRLTLLYDTPPQKQHILQQWVPSSQVPKSSNLLWRNPKRQKYQLDNKSKAVYISTHSKVGQSGLRKGLRLFIQSSKHNGIWTDEEKINIGSRGMFYIIF